MRVYDVRWAREGRWFIAHAVQVRGANTQAFTRAQLDRYMREVLDEFFEVPKPYRLRWRKVPVRSF